MRADRVHPSLDRRASDSGAGLDAQRRAIRREASGRHRALVEIFQDAASPRSLTGSPRLQDALRAIEDGQAGTLLDAKLDRLSRSLLDFAALMERRRKGGWALLALDLGVDTTTPAGEMMANSRHRASTLYHRLYHARLTCNGRVADHAGIRKLCAGPPTLAPLNPQRSMTCIGGTSSS